jgi:hypothetical protein
MTSAKTLDTIKNATNFRSPNVGQNTTLRRKQSAKQSIGKSSLKSVSV